jgi:hypothetical protein
VNAAEHIVEAYFRLVRHCFTLSDVKVLRGNNRQLDLLAINLKTDEQFHVEVGVTHQVNWNSSIQELCESFESKFFGKPPARTGKMTDHAKGKQYFDQILNTYRVVGLDPAKIQRVWVCWIVTNPHEQEQVLAEYSRQRKLTIPIRILSFRDDILVKLQREVATSNYDDEVLRTLSLIKQQAMQCSPP